MRTAVEATKRIPVIPYSQMDCQAFVEYCVNANDGKMDFAGSNHMYREACTTIYPLPEAQSKRLLKPGWLLFIVEPVNERTPAKYRTDGKGDASHVGIYTDYDGVEVAHSSGSRGGVYPSTLKNGWTHCGPVKAIDYTEATGGAMDNNHAPQGSWATVIAGGGGLIMRDKPGGAYLLKLVTGTRIPVLATTTVGGITHVQTTATNPNGTHTGWVAATDASGKSYLQFLGVDAGDGADGRLSPDTGPSPTDDYQRGYDAGYKDAIKDALAALGRLSVSEVVG